MSLSYNLKKSEVLTHSKLTFKIKLCNRIEFISPEIRKSADVQSCKIAEFRLQILERELKLVKIVRLSRKWLTSSL